MVSSVRYKIQQRLLTCMKNRKENVVARNYQFLNLNRIPAQSEEYFIIYNLLYRVASMQGYPGFPLSLVGRLS